MHTTQPRLPDLNRPGEGESFHATASPESELIQLASRNRVAAENGNPSDRLVLSNRSDVIVNGAPVKLAVITRVADIALPPPPPAGPLNPVH